MPTYEYRCLHCGSQLTVQASMHDPQPERTPTCTSEACRLEKCISRVFGQVAGVHPAPVEKPPVMKEKESTGHVCSKYCDLHK